MRRLLIILISIFIHNIGFSQTYNITAGGTSSTCTGTFVSSSNCGSWLSGYTYCNNENYTKTFCSSTAGQQITVTFNNSYSFNTEANWDWLYVYDGPNTSAPYLGRASGTEFFSITSTSGCLTFRFISDGSTTAPGWSGLLSCMTLVTGAPTVQDCLGAIPICNNSYSTTASYTGTGNYKQEINGVSSCLRYGEKNDVWYIFTVQNSGNLTFSLTPNNSSDDYDWAIYNLTTGSCSDIYHNSALQVSCNYSATSGATGCSSSGTLNSQNSNGTLWNAPIPATIGQTYVINVSNFSSTQYGYTIDFSSAAGVIVDNTAPTLKQINNSPACGQSTITFEFTENVLCSSVQANDFTVTGPGGTYTITSISGAQCSIGATYGRVFTITLNTPLTAGGTYSLNMVGQIDDVCGNVTTLNSKTFTVTGVSASATATTQVSCFGGNNGVATATATGGTSPYSYQWSTSAGNQTTAIASNLPAGTHTVTITDNVGVCNIVSSVTITQPTQLSTSANTTNISCNGGNNGAIDLSVSGGTPTYSYNWSNSATSQDLNSLLPGTYTVTVTDSKTCATTASFTITQPAALSVSNTNTEVSCYGLSNGNSTANVSGGTAPYTYQWNDPGFQTTQTANNLPSGTYNVTVTDFKGCTTTSSVTITQPQDISLTSSSTQASCGMPDGTATVTATGGSGSFTYSWSPTGYTGNGTDTYSDLPGGNYTVTVTDAMNCSKTTVINVNEQGAPTAAINNFTNISCFGDTDGSAQVTVSGGTPPYTYLWNTTETTDQISNLGAGTYNVTVVDNDGNGCSSTATIILTQPAKLNASIINFNEVSCNSGNNGSAQVTVNGGVTPFTYNWSNSQTTQNIQNLTAGVYSVTVTDDNSCQSLATITITEPTVIQISSTVTDANCSGNSDGAIDITVSGGISPYTYSWSNSSLDQDIFNLSAGNYTVTVYDANNCSKTHTVSVNEPTLLNSSSIKTNVTCNGLNNGTATTLPTGGVPPYTYLWSDSNNQTTSTSSNLSPGAYYVTITDVNNCTVVNSVTITEPAELILVNDSIKHATCGNSDGYASVIANGGTTPYTYLWDNNASNATTPSVTNLLSNIYQVTVTDSKSCTDTLSIQINNLGGGLATISSYQNVSCFGRNDGEATASVTGGSSPFTYYWSHGQDSITATKLFAGTYEVTIIDAMGCESTTSVTITQPTEITYSITSTNVSCYGGNNGQATVTASGGNPPFSFKWSNDTLNTTNTATSLNATGYYVTITDASNCPVVGSITITQPQALAITYATTNVSCQGGTNGGATAITSGGTAPYSYNWSSGGNASTEVGLSAGTYYLTVTDSKGCSKSDSLTITQPTLGLVVTSSSKDASCFGGSDGTATIESVTGGTSPYTYAWSANNQSGQTAVGLTANTYYTVTITDANNCQGVKIFQILSPTKMVVVDSLTKISHVSCMNNNDGSIEINVEGGIADYSFQWSYSGKVTNKIENLVAGEYYVTVTDFKGCTLKDTIIINNSDLECLEIPTAFTPNNDGINDYWEVKHIDLYPKSSVEIFNRWGAKIFEASPYKNDFDGKNSNGKDYPVGSYVFILKLDDNIEPKTGVVTIIR